MNFGDGSEAAHRHTDALADDGEFTNARIKNSVLTILLLQAGKALVHVADFAEVFPESKYQWVGGKELIEISIQDLISIDGR